MKNALGLGGVDRDPIDYTERAPLVVPPSSTLPPPGTGADSLAINDPDVAARRLALTDPRRPFPPSDPGAGAQGLSARTYLIDPPSGMRDPNVIASGIQTDKSTPVAKTPHRRHASKKVPIRQAAQ